MMCGLCVEACPFDAIEMTHDYELARIDPDALVVDLLTDVPAAQPKKRAAALEAEAAPTEPADQPAADAATNGGEDD